MAPKSDPVKFRVHTNGFAGMLSADAAGITMCLFTVFCDDNKKCLSADLVREEPVKAGYLTPEIGFLGYEAPPRAH